MQLNQPEQQRFDDQKRFGRDKRLLTAGDFQSVFNNPEFKVSHGNYLLLASTNRLQCSRLGLVVAKKNIKLAVARNRVKRVVRETFRHSQHLLGNVDVVFLARRGMQTLSHQQQSALMQRGWGKLANKVAGASAKQSVN